MRYALLTLGSMSCFAWLGLTTNSGQPPAKDNGPVVGKEWRALQNELAGPFDRVQLADKSWVSVQPLRRLWSRGGKVDAVGKDGKAVSWSNEDILAVEYFEDLVLKQIDNLLGKKSPGDLLAAEPVLVDLGRRHRSFRAGPPLGKNPWQAFRERIDGKLQEVRAARLSELTADNGQIEKWNEALNLANRWLPWHSHPGPVREKIADLWTRQADALVKQGQGPQAFSWLLKTESEFPGRAATEVVRNSLRNQARELVKQAHDASPAEAQTLLRQARATWPDLPELEEARAKRGPGLVLFVGAAEVPLFLSPSRARTPVEKQAVDLVFEDVQRLSLPARSVDDLDPARRELKSTAFWSNGKPVTAGDVRLTVDLLRRSNFYEEVLGSVGLGEHPRYFSLALRQGTWDEASVFRFAILPEQYRGKPLARIDDGDFAQAPIGTGPYRFVGIQLQKDRKSAVFRPNPYYHGPAPTIEEIRFLATPEGQPDSSPWHLLIEPDIKLVKALGAPYRLVSLPPRGVHVLALNHRHPVLANESVRRALAHAIDRVKILTDSGNEHKGEAFSANSLSFRASWAQCPPPRVPAQLYQPETARSLIKKAGIGKVELTLCVPASDSWAHAACQSIADHVAKLESGVSIKILPLSPPALHDAVQQHKFDLAYHLIEDPESAMTLWSLFDVRPAALKPGGTNILGYENDAKLDGLLRDLVLQRQFPPLREAYHNLHEYLQVRMPLIPLWQLPTLVSVHSSLTIPALEGPAIFRNVSEWKLAPSP